MAHQFIVEFTEDGSRKQERAEVGNFDGNVEQAQELFERIWGGAMPYRTDVKVLRIVGAGEVSRAPQVGSGTPATDAQLIAREIKRGEAGVVQPTPTTPTKNV
jgi:hypothetical protein